MSIRSRDAALRFARRAPLLLVLTATGCGSCFSPVEPGPDCDGWSTAAPAVAVEPPWGVAGTDFVATFAPLSGADDYEAEVALFPYTNWAPIPAGVGVVSFQPSAPGYYQIRIRATRDGCESTDWALTETLEVRMTWNDAGATGHWSPRVNHESVVFAGQVWVLGGFTDTEDSDEIWTTVDGTTWTRIIPTSPHWPGRGAHEAVVFDDRLWVLGGVTENGIDNDIWWTDDGLVWNEVPASGHWSPRSGHEVAVLGNALWLTGGSDWVGPANSDWIQFNDVWTSGDGLTWVLVTSAAPWSERTQHEMLEWNGVLWITGGTQFDTDARYDDVWWSTDGSVWTEATVGPHWEARHGHSTVIFDDRFWVLTGALTPFVELTDLWYSADGLEWTEAATFGPQWSGRKFHTSVVFGGRIWVMGGWNMTVGRTNDVWLGP